jgi:2-polyprenyl-3-methyl-5-hydroxy-6-metoxy-1,4-benzoquinol methylase
MNYYAEKGNSYFSFFREDIYTILKQTGKYERALEVGCGNGSLLNLLKKEKIVKSVVGIEPYGLLEPGSNFDEYYPDTIINVLPNISKLGKFDLIIFSDVLEHLEDPWSILNVICKESLNINGTVIVSIPNFRNFLTISKILFHNSFKYESEGVLDKTHLRFFCKKDIEQMLINAGLEIQLLTPAFKYRKTIFFKKQNRYKYINNITLNIFHFWLTQQIIAVAIKKKIQTPT